MPYRSGLHTMVELMADYAVCEGRKVIIEITNGTEISLRYEPPLHGAVELEMVAAERRLFDPATKLS